MKKSFKKVSIFLVLTVLIQALVVVPAFAELKEMAPDLDNETAVQQAMNSEDLDIFVVGQPSNTIADMKFNLNKVNDLDKVKASKQYKSIWIAENLQNAYLNENGIKQLDKYLDKGYSICFLGLSDMNMLQKLFTGNPSGDQSQGNTDIAQAAAYVTKNREGEYFFGHIMSNDSYNNEAVAKALLASAWNRRNDLNSTKKLAEQKFSNIFNEKVYADGGSSFTIGSSWRCVYGWQWYNWSVSNTWTTGKTYTCASYVEWKAGFYLTNPVDGKDYYALAIEGCMSPKQNIGDTMTAASDKLEFISHADGSGQSNVIRDYNPKQTPSTSSLSFSMGAAYGKDGPSANIGCSYTITVGDLEVQDKSYMGDWKSDILFSYKGKFSSYAKNTSWQNTAVIYQAPAGSTYCIMHNQRTASFAMNALGAIVKTYGSVSPNYDTYLYK